MFTQLNPQLLTYVVPNPDSFPVGAGMAIGVIDYGIEHHMLWGIVYNNTGEIWWVPNPYVRLQFNPSAGRMPVKQQEQVDAKNPRRAGVRVRRPRNGASQGPRAADRRSQ